MTEKLVSSFAYRLRDVLATLEAASLIGAAQSRMRGLGEQLQFACIALPCDEALVALELRTLGRLRVPGVANAESWRDTDHEFLPSGTPFAFLLGGGSGYAVELGEDDDMVSVLAPVLETVPRYAIFVPIRVGGTVLGGAALLCQERPLGDAELSMAERLAEVLSLTVESHRSERVLLEVFASALPDLCAADAPTDFAQRLEEYVHQLRISTVYRRRLELAETIGRIAAHGSAETRLVVDVLERVETYMKELTSGQEEDEGPALSEGLTDELY